MPAASRLAELGVRAMALASDAIENAAPFVIEWPLDPGTAAFAVAAAAAEAAEARERERERLKRAGRSAGSGFNANAALRTIKSVVEHLIRRCEVVDRKERRSARVVSGVLNVRTRRATAPPFPSPAHALTRAFARVPSPFPDARSRQNTVLVVCVTLRCLCLIPRRT